MTLLAHVAGHHVRGRPAAVFEISVNV
jgi:hypothetical protein